MAGVRGDNERVPAPDDAVCPICREAVDPESAVACSDCSAPHHPECWEYAGGCSMFGCGSRENLDFKSIRAALKGRELAIDERTRPPLQLEARFRGLQRKIKTRSKHLPRTLLAGIGGAFASIGCYVAFLPPAGPDGRLYMAILLTGFLYGFSAPFLAPSQHRYPLRTAMASLAAFVGLFLVGDTLRLSGITALALVVPLFYLAFLFASSAAERLAGSRQWLGEKLGFLAMPARMAFTWAFAVGLMLTTVVLDRGLSLPSTQVIGEIALWGLLASGTAGTAMETGKQSYRAELPEET